MTTLILFACPGMPDRATVEKYENALKGLGSFALRWIAHQGFSKVFVQQAASRRRGDGRLLPATIDKYASGVSVSKVAFVGYSAGCWYARDGLLRHPDDRAALDACLFIDGLHATKAQLVDVGHYVEEGGKVFMSHTDVETYGYPSTTETAKNLENAGIAAEVFKMDTAGLTQKQQHGRALTQHGPDVVRDHLVPFLKAGATEPAPESVPAFESPAKTLAERLLVVAGEEFILDVKEIPGPKHHQRILEYSRKCKRGGVFNGVDEYGNHLWSGGFPLPLPRDEDAWCAAFRSWLLAQVLEPGDMPPHGLRVSVRELCEDARRNGTLRLHGQYQPKLGDAVIYGRNGQSPLHGGQGHVTTAIAYPDYPDMNVLRCIGGNETNAIRVQDRLLSGPTAPVAYIET